jgi:hypothetical protein
MLKFNIRRYLVASLAAIIVAVGLVVPTTAATATYAIAAAPAPVCTTASGVTTCVATIAYSSADAFEWTPPAGIQMSVSMWGGVGGPGGSDTDQPWCSSQGNCGTPRGGSWGYGSDRISFALTTDGTKLTAAPGSAGGGGATDDGASMSFPDPVGTGGGAAGVNYYTQFNGGRGGHAGDAGWSGAGGGGGAATILKIGASTYIAGGGGGGVGGNRVANASPGTMQGFRNDAISTGLPGVRITGDGGGAGGGGGGLVGGLGGIQIAAGEASGTAGNTGFSQGPTGATLTKQTSYTHGGITFTWVKIAQTGFTETSANSFLTYLPGSAATTTVSTTGGQSSGAVTYSTTTSAICSVNATTGVVKANTAGTCVVKATKAGDLKYDLATATTEIVISRSAQARLTANAAAFSTTFPAGTTVTTTGGSGTGAVTYATNTPAVCTVNANNGTVTAVTAGTCQILATKAADTNHAAPATDTVDVLILKGNQTITASTNPTTVAFTGTATAAASAGLGTGANTYTVSTPAICSIDQVTRVITPISVGTCTFTATKATDSKYLAATSAAVNLNITKGTQPALIASAALPIIADTNLTNRVSTTGGAGTGAVTFATTTPLVCAIDSATGVITPIAIAAGGAAATCTITATKAADANYNAVTSAAINVSIRTEEQATLVATSTSASTAVPTTVTVSVPATNTPNGGQGTGAVSFASTTPTICSVNASTGIVTPLIAGSCLIVATRAGDGTFAPKVSAPLTITVAKGTQSALDIGLAANVTFPNTVTATLPASGAVGGGNGSGAVTFATSTPSICSVNASTGVVTPLAAGACKVSATRAATDSYNVATSAEETLTIARANQTALVASVSLAVIADTNVTNVVTSTGGLGTGIVTFATSTPSVCSVSATTGVITPASIAPGAASTTCTITATKAADNQYNQITSAAVSVTIKTDVQAVLTPLVTANSTVVPTPVTISVPAAGTPGGGSGVGAISYTSISPSICTVAANGTVTPLRAGSCQVTATRATDANYVSNTSAPITITVGKGTPSALVEAVNAATIAYGTATSTASVTGGVNGGAVSYATSTPAICSVNATTGVISSVKAGACLVTATKAATDSYNSVTSNTVTVTITPAAQSTLSATVSPTSIRFTSTAAVSTPANGVGSGSGTGAVTYATTTPTICSVAPATGVATPRSVGTCTLNATKAATAELYNAATSANVNLTITKGDQAPLIAALSNSTILIGGSTASTISTPASGSTGGGLGNGTVTYTSSTPSICTVNSTTGAITAVAFGECSLTATRAAGADGLYLAATSAPVILTVTRAAQAALSLSIFDTAATQASLGTASTLNFGDYQDAVATGGTGAGAISYAVATGSDFCIVDATTGIITPVKAGICTVKATKAGTASVLPVVSNAVTVTVVKGAQDALAVTLSATTSTFPTGATASVPATGTANGGNGTGAVTYASTTSAICSVDSATGVITPITAGTCKVTATRAGTDYFLPKTSPEVTLTIAKAAQPLAVTISPSSAVIGKADAGNPQTTVTLTVPNSGVAGGGNGTGAVTFTSTGSGCSVNSTTGLVTPLLIGGTCSVTAVRAGNASYLDKSSSNTVVVTVRKAQATLTLAPSVPTTTTPFGTTVQLSTTGATTGALSYTSATPTICTVSSSGVVSPVTVGSCEIIATRAGDATFAPSISNRVTIAVVKAAQAPIAITAPVAGTSVALSSAAPTVTVPASGVNSGSGTGARSFATSTPTVCSINASTGALSLLAAGACKFSVAKAGDANYNAATSPEVTLTVTKGVQGALVATATPSALQFHQTSTVSVPAAGTTNGGKGTGVVSYVVDPTAAAICSVNASSGVVTPTTVGTCKVLATRAEDTNYNSVTSAAVSIVITKGVQASLTLSASRLTAVNVPVTTVNMTVPATGTGSGSGIGAVTYSVTGTGCSINASTGLLTATGFPDCIVSASKAGDTNYNAATSNSVTVSFLKPAQASLVANATPNPVVFSQGGTVAVTVPAAGLPGGGSGAGALSFTVDPLSNAVCSINSTTGVVTTLKAGTCVVTAIRAEDANFEAAIDDLTLIVEPANQLPLAVSINQVSVDWKNPGVLLAQVPSIAPGNGSGTGAVTYRSLSPAICLVNLNSGQIILPVTPVIGDCLISATKAADEQYLLAVSETAVVSVTRAEQSALAAESDDSSIGFGETGAVASPDEGIGSGSGSGDVTYLVTAATSANCSVNLATGVITPKAIGVCEVYSTKAADDLYTVQTSNVVEIAIVKGNQVITYNPVNRILSAGKFNADGVSSLTTVKPTYVSTTPDICAVTGISITPKAVGSCTIVASAAGNALFNAAQDVSKTFQITTTKSNQTLSHTPTSSSLLTEGDVELDAELSSGAKPVITIAKDSAAVCSVVEGMLRGLKAGICNYTVGGPAIGAFNALAARPFRTTFTQAANETTMPFPAGVSPADPRVITISDELVELEGASSADLDVRYSTANPLVCWVDSEGLLHLQSVGICSVVATSGGGEYVLSASEPRVFTIQKSGQTLTFTAPGEVIPDSDPEETAPEATSDALGFKLSATLSSGLDPVYRSLDPAICIVEEDGTVTWSGDMDATPAQDTCRVGISSPGTASYDAVPEQIKTIRAVKPAAEIPPVGGSVKETPVTKKLPRTGGTVSKGPLSFNVGITSKTFVVKPQSKGMLIGPITANIIITYEVKGLSKTQNCATTFGIAAKDSKGKPITDPSKETKASVKAVLAPYLKMPKFGSGSKKGWYDAKVFTNSASCTLNSEAFAFFKAGGVITAKAEVYRDRRWPTTYLRKYENGKPIYPTTVMWNLSIG